MQNTYKFPRLFLSLMLPEKYNANIVMKKQFLYNHWELFFVSGKRRKKSEEEMDETVLYCGVKFGGNSLRSCKTGE